VKRFSPLKQKEKAIRGSNVQFSEIKSSFNYPYETDNLAASSERLDKLVHYERNKDTEKYKKLYDKYKEDQESYKKQYKDFGYD